MEKPSIEKRKIQIPNVILMEKVREAILSGHTATISVKGYSMRPFLEHERDKVTLAQATSPKVGDAALAEIQKGTYVLHRIIAIDNGHVTLMGDGNLKGVEHCNISDIIAIVTHYFHKGKCIKATDERLCYRIHLWKQWLPLRRYLLYIYKIQLRINDLFRIS